MNNRFLGILLLALAGLVVAGLLINNPHLWLVIDLAVITGCGTAGIILLRR
ncbi:MAG: hypothetical protein AB1439_04940 [candidate division FCPU426 bacterium]